MRKRRAEVCYNPLMDYYKRELFIPQVNENDDIVGKIERWEAHTKGILHRGFTVGLLYQRQMICQHRKHPVFDGFIDLTASSHQVYEDDVLQDAETAVLNCLEREWHVTKSDLTSDIALQGKVVYDSIHGDYIEHEVCHLYIASVKHIPEPNFEFAYGFSVIPIDQLIDYESNPALRGLAPWVLEMIMKDLLNDLH